MRNFYKRFDDQTKNNKKYTQHQPFGQKHCVLGDAWVFILKTSMIILSNKNKKLLDTHITHAGYSDEKSNIK